MLFLVRHGETEWNLQKRLQGQKDIPLSQIGIEQAQQLEWHFQQKQIVFEHIYTSDLLRAKQTAQLLAGKMHQKMIIAEPTLRERYYGELEGKYIAEIEKLIPNYQVNFGEKMLYGIESLEDMQKRMAEIMTSIAIKSEDSPTLIVSHGGAINAFLHFITSGEMGTGKGRLANTAITQLQWSSQDQTFQVKTYNDTPHIIVN